VTRDYITAFMGLRLDVAQQTQGFPGLAKVVGFKISGLV
jgi:hypothetical protein